MKINQIHKTQKKEFLFLIIILAMKILNCNFYKVLKLPIAKTIAREGNFSVIKIINLHGNLKY